MGFILEITRIESMYPLQLQQGAKPPAQGTMQKHYNLLRSGLSAYSNNAAPRLPPNVLLLPILTPPPSMSQSHIFIRTASKRPVPHRIRESLKKHREKMDKLKTELTPYTPPPPPETPKPLVVVEKRPPPTTQQYALTTQLFYLMHMSFMLVS